MADYHTKETPAAAHGDAPDPLPRKQAAARAAALAPAGDDIVNVRRRQGRSVTTRRNILRSALEEFSTLGFDGATTRSIADRAGVPHGLVIYHFETKLGIWRMVIDDALRELHDQFQHAVKRLEGNDPEIILRAVYADFIRFSGKRPEVGWLLSHELAGRSDRRHWLMERLRDHDLEQTLDLIRSVQAAGRFVEGDPAHLHFVFLGAATRVFGLPQEVEHHLGLSPFDPAFLERHVDLCLRLFFQAPHGPRRRPRQD